MLTVEYVITSKFSKLVERSIPYEENTKAWHSWLDISTTHSGAAGQNLDVQKILAWYDLDWTDCESGFQELVEDGYLELKYNY